MVDDRTAGRQLATANSANQVVIISNEGGSPGRTAPVRCTACRSGFAVEDLPAIDIRCLDDQLTLQERYAELADYKAFKIMFDRYPVLADLIRPIWDRRIPISPQLSAALAERLGQALTDMECEVLDRRNHRGRYWDYPFRLHDLSKDIDRLVEKLAGKTVLCRTCSRETLILDRHVCFADDCQ